MNKLFVAMACSMVLTGCGDSVSGKYEGTWKSPGLTYKIEVADDHYRVEKTTSSPGSFEFVAKEDSDGFLIDPDDGKRLLKWQDANTVITAGERILNKI